MSKTRAKPTGLSAANVERLLLADQSKAKTTRAQRNAAKRAANDEAKIAQQAERDAEAVASAARAVAHAHDEAADVLRAQRIDFDALYEAGSLPATTSFADYLLDQGFDATGHPVKQAHDAKTPYNGPMIALKTARRSYVKAANGILCNGSPLALLCGKYKREVVVAGLIEALGLPGNPYLQLNPGQQSMNLRNKARHAMVDGRLSLVHVEACLEAAAKA